MKLAIDCHRVCFGYEAQEILTDVTLTVAEGEFIGIIGPNGGGKSTFLKLIMGFLKPIHGTLSVFQKKPEDVQKKMAYVPQSMGFDRHFPITVLELVLQGRLSSLSFWGRFSQKDHMKALLSLEQVGLENLAKKPFNALSGGQQQRVLIARALASDPELLLLDEPTAHVDSEAESEILHLLNTIRKDRTILMVTHDLKTAVNQFDRVFVVKHEILSYSPAQVCEHYALGLYHPPLIDMKKHTHD